MSQRQTIKPNILPSPVNSRIRCSPSLRANRNRTPMQNQQRKILPLIIDEYEYSYSNYSSEEENVKSDKISSDQKKSSAFLIDYSSDDDIVNINRKVDTNLNKNTQSTKPSNQYDSYSDSYSLPLFPKKKTKFSKETKILPHKNQNPNTQPPEKSKKEITSLDQTPEISNCKSESNQSNQNQNNRIIEDNQRQNNQNQTNQIIKDNRRQNNRTNKNDQPNFEDINNSNSNEAETATNNDNQNNNTNNTNTNSYINNSSSVANDSKFRHFTLIRKSGKLNRLKTHLFTSKSKVYTHSKDKKNADKKVLHYFVGEAELQSKHSMSDNSKKKNDKFSIDDSIAYLKWDKKLTQFTLCLPQLKDFRDDRQGQLLGVFVDTNSENVDLKHGDFSTSSYLVFTAVIPANGAPFFPASERLNLVEIAREFSEASNISLKKSSSSPLIKTKKSKKKSTDDDCESGNVSSSGSCFNPDFQGIDNRFIKLVQSDLKNMPEDELGDIFYQKSTKNFAFVDESTGKPLFLFYKSSKNTYSLKVRSPMLPLQAHALAVVILKRNMQWQFV